MRGNDVETLRVRERAAAGGWHGIGERVRTVKEIRL